MKYMSVREFLRGGYQTVAEPTVVMKHGYPLFSVFPAGQRETKEVKLMTIGAHRTKPRADV